MTEIIEKDKFFNDEGSDSDFTESDDMGNYEEDNELKEKLEKYNLFFKLLEEDLIGYSNFSLITSLSLL